MKVHMLCLFFSLTMICLFGALVQIDFRSTYVFLAGLCGGAFSGGLLIHSLRT